VSDISLLPAALRIARRREMRFPAGVETFGLRACRPDFTSRNGFRWPFPGRWAEAGGPFLSHRGGCPHAAGDGLCVAHSWDGMASGGITAHLVLLVGWHTEDVLGAEGSKSRVKRVFVIDALTVAALLAERSEDEEANLRGADLCGADLRGADLCGAYLRGANLRGADLCGAYLRGAYLRGADLRGANLRGADRDDLRKRGAYVD
jgi:hypothetical protein